MSLFEAEDYTTSSEAIRKIGKIISDRHLEHGTLYDLGSCRGSFVFGILGVCPDLRVIGIDKDALKIRFSKLRRFFHSYRTEPVFLQADIFDADVSDVDMAFVYVPRPFLPAIETKLQHEMKIGALAITYRINFPNRHAIEVFPTDMYSEERNNIFVYQKA